jgi:hypothetical protein
LAVRVFAVHDPGLDGVQLKAQGPEPFGDGDPKRSGLFLGVAVCDDVICITREWAARKRPGHPTIERIVHEQVG